MPNISYNSLAWHVVCQEIANLKAAKEVLQSISHSLATQTQTMARFKLHSCNPRLFQFILASPNSAKTLSSTLTSPNANARSIQAMLEPLAILDKLKHDSFYYCQYQRWSYSMLKKKIRLLESYCEH